MEETYMLGAPAFAQVFDLKPEKEFLVPFGQIKLCHNIIKETQDKAVIVERLAREYLSIVLALREMKKDFYITYTDDARITTPIMRDLKDKLGCKLATLPKDFPLQFACYPRDMLIILPKAKIVLLNQEISGEKIGQHGEYCFIPSLYGEGGRVLPCDDTMLVPKKLIINNTRKRCDEQLKILLQKGVKIGQLPVPLGGICTLDKIEEKLVSNDHLDRVSTLIKGIDGKLHLVLDPKICVVDEDKNKDWIPLGPEDSIARIMEHCDPWGIKVHYPYKIKIPCSINLEQFSDGRILMTGGDKPMAKIIERIAGWKNVIQTKVPIKYTPVYNRAGLRCMLGKIPEPMIAAFVGRDKKMS